MRRIEQGRFIAVGPVGVQAAAIAGHIVADQVHPRTVPECDISVVLLGLFVGRHPVAPPFGRRALSYEVVQPLVHAEHFQALDQGRHDTGKNELIGRPDQQPGRAWHFSQNAAPSLPALGGLSCTAAPFEV